jgi:hypothetical protein
MDDKWLESATKELYNNIKEMIKDKKVDLESLMEIAKIGMQILEHTVDSGPKRKAVLIAVLHRIVEDAPISKGTQDILSDVIDFTVSKAIDLIIAASKGILDINKPVKCNKCLIC